MFVPHVGHKDLPGAEEAIAISTGITWKMNFLKCWRWRPLFSLVLAVDISSVFFIVINQVVAVGTVGVSGLGAEREVDAQVWGALSGLQGSMDGLKGFQTELWLKNSKMHWWKHVHTTSIMTTHMITMKIKVKTPILCHTAYKEFIRIRKKHNIKHAKLNPTLIWSNMSCFCA